MGADHQAAANDDADSDAIAVLPWLTTMGGGGVACVVGGVAVVELLLPPHAVRSDKAAAPASVSAKRERFGPRMVQHGMSASF